MFRWCHGILTLDGFVNTEVIILLSNYMVPITLSPVGNVDKMVSGGREYFSLRNIFVVIGSSIKGIFLLVDH